ncbi:transposase [Paraburkholderia sp. CI3]|uniref:transposase n=1 Tax=Paraburkholderia sp. CI3 TaxID=2991060 RepID=UPI003D1ADEC7
MAFDETSYRRGHEYLTLVADMQARRVVFVTTGKDASTIERFAAYLGKHDGTPEQICSVSIDMSPAFVKGVNEHLPDARVTFDKFHVVAHASKALDTVRRQQQKIDPQLKGMRWDAAQRRGQTQSRPTDRPRGARQPVHHQAYCPCLAYREQLRDILERRQINVVSAMLQRWCTNVMRSKVEPMKDVVRLIRRHFDGIIVWTQTRQTTGSSRLSTACFKPPSAKHAATLASKQCAQSYFSSLENSTSHDLMSMPDEPVTHSVFKKAENVDLHFSSLPQRQDGTRFTPSRRASKSIWTFFAVGSYFPT